LPLEIGGVDYRPANSGAYLPESDLPKIKSVFWHNNIIAFAPTLDVSVQAWSPASKKWSSPGVVGTANLIGTWSDHAIPLSDEKSFVTGAGKRIPGGRLRAAGFLRIDMRRSSAQALPRNSMSKLAIR